MDDLLLRQRHILLCCQHLYRKLVRLFFCFPWAYSWLHPGLPTAPEDVDQGFTSRSRAVLATLEKRAAAGESTTSIVRLAAGNSRVEAARLFFEALVLHSKGLVQLEQDAPYGDMRATIVASMP